MCKVFDLLSYGQIEDYINDEDIDPEDLADNDGKSEKDSDSSDSSSEESEEESEEDSEEDSYSKSSRNKSSDSGIPPTLLGKNK